MCVCMCVADVVSFVICIVNLVTLDRGFVVEFLTVCKCLKLKNKTIQRTTAFYTVNVNLSLEGYDVCQYNKLLVDYSVSNLLVIKPRPHLCVFLPF